MNLVCLFGRLGQDPELIELSDDKKVCKFSFATNLFKSGGEKITEWHKVVTWNRTAENCAQYLKKGSQALIEGRVQTRSYEDKEGNKKYITKIVARNVTFVSAGKNESTDKEHHGLPNHAESFDNPPSQDNGDDLPF